MPPLRVPCLSTNLDCASNCLDDGALTSLPSAQDTLETETPTPSVFTSIELHASAREFSARNELPSTAVAFTDVMSIARNNLDDPAMKKKAESDSSDRADPGIALSSPISPANKNKLPQGSSGSPFFWKLS